MRKGNRLFPLAPKNVYTEGMEKKLSRFEFFAGLPDAVLEKISSLMTLRELAAGDTLFLQSDPGAEAFLVLSGGIRIERINEKGDRMLLNILGPGEFMGETALLTGNPRMASAVAQEDSLLCVLKAAQFQDMLALHPEMNSRLMRVISSRLTNTGVKLEEVGLNSLSSRLAGILLDFMKRFPGGPGEINIRLTQTDLAELALSSREHINKILKGWEKERVLNIEQGKIVLLDPEKLGQI